MQKFISTLFTLALLMCFMPPAKAIVAPSKEANAQERLEKLEKRMDKLAHKWRSKNAARRTPMAADIWTDGRFRLGVLALGVGLGLAIIAAIGILSGFFGFLAGLAALAGVILIVWALVDNA